VKGNGLVLGSMADFDISIKSTDDHSGRTVYGMNCLRSLEGWDRGFESHSRHGYLFVFILFLLGSGLATADYSSKESYRMS
jgi:hypothetical protein